MESEKKAGVEVKGGGAMFLAIFILLGSFGGLMYLLSLVVD